MRSVVDNRIALATAFALAIVCVLAMSCRSKHDPEVRHVVIRGMQYDPPTLEVLVGDIVVWTNEDIVPHTVTAAGFFDSQSLTNKQEWRFTATKPGEFAYGCTFHPTMKGALTVR